VDPVPVNIRSKTTIQQLQVGKPKFKKWVNKLLVVAAVGNNDEMVAPHPGIEMVCNLFPVCCGVFRPPDAQYPNSDIAGKSMTGN
jgi:hypothetical protein